MCTTELVCDICKNEIIGYDYHRDCDTQTLFCKQCGDSYIILSKQLLETMKEVAVSQRLKLYSETQKIKIVPKDSMWSWFTNLFNKQQG